MNETDIDPEYVEYFKAIDIAVKNFISVCEVNEPDTDYKMDPTKVGIAVHTLIQHASNLLASSFSNSLESEWKIGKSRALEIFEDSLNLRMKYVKQKIGSNN